MKPLIWIVSFCVIAAAGAWLGYNYGVTSQTETSDVATVDNSITPATIRGQGKLQPAGGTISVVAQPGERIDELLIKVGQVVEADEPLIVLASRKVRELELELSKIQKLDAIKQAEIQLKANQFKIQAAEIATSEAKSTQSKIDNQGSTIDALRSNLDSAQRVLHRLQSLRSAPATKDLVGQTEIEKQQAVVESLQAQLQTAEGDVSIGNESAERAELLAKSQLEMAKFNMKAAPSLVPTESLDLGIKLAQMAYDATLLKSPIAGMILDVTINQGDTVTNRPLILVGDTTQMVCVAEITDSQLRDVQLDAVAELTSNAYEGILKGTVIEIGTMIGPPSISDPNPFAAVDRKTGKVKILIDSSDAKIAGRFVNLQVEVKILKSSDDKSTSDTNPKTSKPVSKDKPQQEPVIKLAD